MNNDLDFSGRTQLYYQLYDILYNDIKNGIYKPGELLPTEYSLIEKYKVSRITVRKAMDMLLKDGLITKKRGYGTVVQTKRVEQSLTKVLHFSSEMQKQGYNTYTKVLSNEIVLASKEMSSTLNLNESSKLINVNRLRCANDIPMCLEMSFLNYEKCKDVLNQDFSKKSLRLYLDKKYNIKWTKATQKIYAIVADNDLAFSLNISPGDPLIYIERISYDQFDIPGEYLQVYYRADSYYLSAELNADTI